MGKKAKHREDVAFQDYRQDSRKVYKRQLREMKPDVEAYEKEKLAAVQKAAMSGGLEIVETDDGELVAVDKNGTFYSTADSTDFVENKPDRAAVDRLVTDLRKAEETRLRKRRDRGKGDDDGDVTYINDKVNYDTLFNLNELTLTSILEQAIQFETCALLQQSKECSYAVEMSILTLRQYTAEIRDSFERGTMI